MHNEALAKNYDLADWNTQYCQEHFPKIKVWIVRHPNGIHLGENRFVVGCRKTTQIVFDFVNYLALSKPLIESTDDEIRDALAQFIIRHPNCFSYISE